MMQEPEISLEAGMQPDEMVDELGRVLGKYEVPMGLMNKRKLTCCKENHTNLYFFVSFVSPSNMFVLSFFPFLPSAQ
jgi:hypothetical protein